MIIDFLWRLFLKILYEYIGLIISFTGLIHCLIGLTSLRDKLDLFKENNYSVWFLLAGFALILIGLLVDWVVRVQGLKVPLYFVLGFLVMALIIIALIPKSGGWLILVEAIILIVGSLS